MQRRDIKVCEETFSQFLGEDTWIGLVYPCAEQASDFNLHMGQ